MPRPIVRTLAILSKIVALANGLLLGIFTLRRLIFIYVTRKRHWTTEDERETKINFHPPYLLLLVPIHNEASILPTFLTALSQLDYPAAQLTTVFVNDGSTDGSDAILQRWTAGKPQAHVVTLPHNVGKAQALNEALWAWGDSAASTSPSISSGGTSGQAEFIAIYDADDLPQPDALQHLLKLFSDPQVAAVTGRRAISNPLASLSASYATYENLVHQHVTVSAKHALDLAPPILGSNCVYRRTALMQLGGFTPNALLEDSDLTIRFARAGWHTAYAPAAISHHAVPATLRGYMRQHLRWARGFQTLKSQHFDNNFYLRIIIPNESSRRNLSPKLTIIERFLAKPRNDNPNSRGCFSSLTSQMLTLQLELMLFSTGYLDRAALLLSLLQMRRHPLLRIPIVAYLVLPFAQTIAALNVEKAPRKLWLRIWVLPIFFCVDITIVLASLLNGLLQRPQFWESRDQRR